MSVDGCAPAPWQVQLLGEVADITLGGTPSTEVAGFWGGNIPWMASGEVNKRHIFEVDGSLTEAGLASSNATLVDPPAVAIGLAGQGKTRGTAALVHIRVCTNQSIALIKGKNGRLDTRFLFHNLDSRYAELRSRSAGGGRAGLSREILQKVPISLPDAREQSRIAVVLDEVDEAIAAMEAVIAKLKQVRAGLLHDLLTRGLDEHGQLRDPIAHPEQFQDSPLGRIPREWEIKTLNEIVASAVDGPFGSNLKTEHYVNKPGVRVVRLQNIESSRFDESDKAFVSEDHALSLQRHQVVSDDLLVASMGDEHHPLARACLYPAHLPSGIVKADCFRLRMKTTMAVNGFVMLFLNCPSTRRELNILGQGVTRDRVNLTTLLTLRVLRPPVEEQRHIVKMIDASDLRIQAEEALRSKLAFLKSGLMTDLLTGRVRVPEKTIGGTAYDS